MILVFEGNDAAGKGGTIRRVTSALDVRQLPDRSRRRAHRTKSAPSLPICGASGAMQPRWGRTVHLRPLPGTAGAGGAGRGFLPSEPDWMRGYAEIINDFEHQLARHGAIVLKFWLRHFLDEQFRLSGAREDALRAKITDEDWRNRAKIGTNTSKPSVMVVRSIGPPATPLVEANDRISPASRC